MVSSQQGHFDTVFLGVNGVEEETDEGVQILKLDSSLLRKRILKKMPLMKLQMMMN